MSQTKPEPWLRGSVPGIPVLLQPVAHALVYSVENIRPAVDGLSEAHLWSRTGGVASIGFHLRHLAGSTDRLLTYARGEALSDAQRAVLSEEQQASGQLSGPEVLLQEWEAVVEAALRQLSTTPEASLTDERLVGRAQFPSTVLGLLFHAAEHAARHTGQIVTTAKLVSASACEQ